MGYDSTKRLVFQQLKDSGSIKLYTKIFICFKVYDLSYISPSPLFDVKDSNILICI